MLENRTIAAIATPPGQGGIAVVRLSGPESYPIAERVFRPMDSRKRVADAKGYTALYGQFADGDDLFDDGIALFFRAPHSYTGEDVVELSCHGGDAVARRLVEACLGAGAVPAGPGEYTRRALLNGKLSLTQAEAVMDLISAGGRQGAALANAARGGALARKIAAQQQALTSLQAHLTAWVDFPEEDVPALEAGPLRDTLSQVKAALYTYIYFNAGRPSCGRGSTAPSWAGPNAGKSTLLNLLAGFDRAIVTPIGRHHPDVVEQAVQLGDIRLNLFDTAGLRDTDDPVEAEGVRRSWAKLAEAGLVLAVFDGSQPLTKEDFALAPALRRVPGHRPGQQGGPAFAVRRGGHRALFCDGDPGLLQRGGGPAKWSPPRWPACWAPAASTPTPPACRASGSCPRLSGPGTAWPARWKRWTPALGWTPSRSAWTTPWPPSTT